MSRAKRTTALDLWPGSEHEEKSSDNQEEEEESVSSEGPDSERIDVVPLISRKATRDDGDERTYTTHLVAHLADEYFHDIEVVENVQEVFVNVDSAVRTKRLLCSKDYIQFIQSLMDKYRESAVITFGGGEIAGRQAVCKQVKIGRDCYNVSRTE